MVFFDITASAHGRASMIAVIERAADQCFMPLTVGGGIRTVQDMHTMLRAGADKTSINSSALATPELITQGAEKFGSQCHCRFHRRPQARSPSASGSLRLRRRTVDPACGLEALAWAKEACERGAGEIVLNSIDADGTKAGYDLVITRRVSESVGGRYS